MANEKIDIKQLFDECKGSLPSKKQAFNDDIQAIEDDIRDSSSSLETKVESWIDTNLKYIIYNINCIHVLHTDRTTKAVIESIMKRQKYLARKFKDTQKRSYQMKKNMPMPFEIQPVIYVKDKLLPLIAEIIIIKDQIILINKKLYKF